MIGSNARRVIAAMTNQHSVRDRPIGHSVGDAMSSTYAVESKLPVVSMVAASLPLPTVGAELDVRPEVSSSIHVPSIAPHSASWGGKPSKGTPKDKRLSRNKPKSGRGINTHGYRTLGR